MRNKWAQDIQLLNLIKISIKLLLLSKSKINMVDNFKSTMIKATITLLKWFAAVLEMDLLHLNVKNDVWIFKH